MGVSDDGNLLAAGTLHADDLGAPAPTIVWDLASGTVKRQWTPPAPVIAGGWTSDGHLVLATATREAVQLWRLY